MSAKSSINITEAEFQARIASGQSLDVVYTEQEIPVASIDGATKAVTLQGDLAAANLSTDGTVSADALDVTNDATVGGALEATGNITTGGTLIGDNVLLPAGGEIGFDDGSYGIRDNAGTMERKNAAGEWEAIAASAAEAGGFTDDGSVVRLTTGTDNVNLGATADPGAKLGITKDGDQLKLIHATSGKAAMVEVDSLGNLDFDPDGQLRLPAETIAAGMALGSDGYRKTWPVGRDDLVRLIAKRTALTNVVAVFIYDTRRDPDGGAWRFAFGTGWYNEAASATRGARKEFPEIAVIVLTTNATGALDIYDASTGALWMRRNRISDLSLMTAYATHTSVSATNGRIFITTSNGAFTGMALVTLDFKINQAWAINGSQSFVYRTGLENQDGNWRAIPTTTHGVLVNGAAQAVHARVINGRTKVAVATNGGVTVLDIEARTAWDITNGAASYSRNVKITPSGGLWIGFGNSSNEYLLGHFASLPTADTTMVSAERSFYTTSMILAGYPKIIPWGTSSYVSPRGITVIPTGSLVDATNEVLVLGSPSIKGVGLWNHGATQFASEGIFTGYRTLPLIGSVDDGPRGHWTFNEDPTGSVSDRTDLGFDLTAINMDAANKAAVATGADLQAYTFNGSDEYLASKVYHDQTNSGASFDSAVWTDGSAEIVITDTDTDLTIYKTTSGGSGYWLVCSDGTNVSYGYVRDVTAVGSDYTFTINNTRAGGTQNWKGAPGSMGAVTSWAIRKAHIRTTAHTTWGAWIKTSSTSAQGIISRWASTGDQRSFMLNLNASAYAEAYVSQDGTAGTIASATGSAALSDGNWHFVVAVFIPSTGVYLYVDGELVASDTSSVPTGIFDSYTDLTIGYGSAAYFNGSIALPFISAESYTAAQVRRVYERSRHWFNAGAKIFLSASNAVKGVAYDKGADTIAVAQDSGSTGAVDYFSGATGVRLRSITTSTSDDTGTALTSNRMVAAAAGGGLAVVGSTTEVYAEPISTDDKISKAIFTALGGLAIQLTAGEALATGDVVALSTAADDTALKVAIDGDMPMGVVYKSAASGAPVWVVVSGIAYVTFDGSTTPTRGQVAYVSGATAGTATSASSLPDTAHHNREIGHVLQSAGGAGGTVRCVLHFN